MPWRAVQPGWISLPVAVSSLLLQICRPVSHQWGLLMCVSSNPDNGQVQIVRYLAEVEQAVSVHWIKQQNQTVVQTQKYAHSLHSLLPTVSHTHLSPPPPRQASRERALLFQADVDMPKGSRTVIFHMDNLCYHICLIDCVLNPVELDLWVEFYFSSLKAQNNAAW